MIKKGILFSLVCLLSACTIKPDAITMDERYAEAQADVKALFQPQKNFPRKIDYYEALARSLKYNLDYRIKLTNTALQAGQLDVAKFTMFPALNVSGSLYTRSNDLSSFGVTSTGAPTDVLNSTPRTLRSARVAMSWNILDFGLGYVRAKEQGNRILIAQEEARKQEQTLAQDVLVAYWDAYNAQQLIAETNDFEALLIRAKSKLVVAMHDKLVPQENILNYQAALLEGNRRLIQLTYKYNKAMLDLRHLLNLPPDQQFVLLAPPSGLTHRQSLEHLNFEKLDAITLVKRPELRGQEYQRRIAQLGVKTVILQALPGITLNDGWNYNSNKFLINNKWMDRSMDVAWNLLNLASLPTTYDAAKLQVKYETIKRMALTIAVLTETRYAYWHYEALSEEYAIAHKQTQNAEAIYKLNSDRRLASLASDQQVILAKLHSLTSKMDEQLLQADLSTALGELYLSCGADILPIDVEDQSVPELTKIIQQNFAFDKIHDFNTYVNNTYKEVFSKQVGAIPSNQSTAQADAQVKARADAQAQADAQAKAQADAQAQAQADAQAQAQADAQAKAQAKAPTNVQPPQTKTAALQANAKTKTLAQPNENKLYTIQLFGSYKPKSVARFGTQLILKKNIYYGITKYNGKDWYVLTLGKFTNIHDANTKMQLVAKELHNQSIWVRNMSDIQIAKSLADLKPLLS
jgi:multidrug efflux system outer membrane protein